VVHPEESDPQVYVNECGNAIFSLLKKEYAPRRTRALAAAARLEQIEKKRPAVGTLDVTLYRDDLSTVAPQPVVKEEPLGFAVDGKTVILVDDVLFTGRTTRASMNALFNYGRPARVQLCVLIDRGWRELPIEATYVGRHLQTAADEIIEVRLRETDKEERVMLVEKVS